MSTPAAVATRWERLDQRVVRWIPYGTLLLPTLLTLIDASIPWPSRVATLGLAAVAALWVFAMHTTAGPARRASSAWMAAYLAGLLAFAGLLMARQPVYFIFAITGFFHATVLRPTWARIAAVVATSLVVNALILVPDPDAGRIIFFALVVTVQSLAIGFGIIGAEKLSALSEERRQAVADLSAALEENAGLQAQLLVQAREAGVLDERQRMAREIHDTLAQGLTGVIAQVEAAASAQDDGVELRRHLDTAAQLARESLAEARRSVYALSPAPLDGSRLPEALEDVAQRWSDVNAVPVHVTTTGGSRPLHPEVEVTLLRAAQEGLANVARHARASRVGVTLSFSGDEVMLDVRDDGVGFDDAAASGGFGLEAMRQRVQRLAGDLAIESEPGGGTAISVRVPAIPAEVGRA